MLKYIFSLSSPINLHKIKENHKEKTTFQFRVWTLLVTVLAAATHHTSSLLY